MCETTDKPLLTDDQGISILNPNYIIPLTKDGRLGIKIHVKGNMASHEFFLDDSNLGEITLKEAMKKYHDELELLHIKIDHHHIKLEGEHMASSADIYLQSPEGYDFWITHTIEYNKAKAIDALEEFKNICEIKSRQFYSDIDAFLRFPKKNELDDEHPANWKKWKILNDKYTVVNYYANRQK